jgi:hypothetical protein
MTTIRVIEETTPATPPAGRSTIFVDSADKTLKTIDDTGLVHTAVGTVTSVSVTTANGVSGSVATPTTTPAISLTLGAITPSSVAASGSVTGSNLSGTNTGDVTLAGSPNYITIVGQVITRALIDLVNHVTGILGVANGGSGRASHTAYAVICGGTTTTAAQQSIAGVGTAGQVLTSNGAGALPTFQPVGASFTSPDQVITSAGALTIAHGLAGTPIRMAVSLVCQTAELGYSIGDVTPIGLSDLVANQGASIVPDATNLNIRFGTQANVFRVLHKTTGASTNITIANWRVRFYASLSV